MDAAWAGMRETATPRPQLEPFGWRRIVEYPKLFFWISTFGNNGDLPKEYNGGLTLVPRHEFYAVPHDMISRYGLGTRTQGTGHEVLGALNLDANALRGCVANSENTL